MEYISQWYRNGGGKYVATQYHNLKITIAAPIFGDNHYFVLMVIFFFPLKKALPTQNDIINIKSNEVN